MMKKMRKGLAALALLGLSLAAAPEAAAYQEVCMNAKFGIGYVFKFRVAWGLQNDFQAAHREERPYHLDGVTDWTGDVLLTKKRCIDTSHIPPGTYFVVQAWAGGVRILCKGWDDRNIFVGEVVPGRRQLWLDAWGPWPVAMRCKAATFK